jgi:hypothetical protein
MDDDLVMLGDCPPGLFLFNGSLGFKSEYKTESLSRPGVWQSDAYVVESGEYFWGGVSDPEARERLMVEPVDWTMKTAVG